MAARPKCRLGRLSPDVWIPKPRSRACPLLRRVDTTARSEDVSQPSHSFRTRQDGTFIQSIPLAPQGIYLNTRKGSADSNHTGWRQVVACAARTPARRAKVDQRLLASVAATVIQKGDRAGTLQARNTRGCWL